MYDLIEIASHKKGVEMLFKLQMNLFNAKAQKGFSLVELMVVMVIIGVLFGIGVPAYKNYQEKARVKAHEASMQNLYNAALMLDTTDELPATNRANDVPDLLIKKVKGFDSTTGIKFNYGSDKNTWCIEFQKMDIAVNLKACVNQEGDVKWGDKFTNKGICRSGRCSGDPQALPLP